MIRPPEPIKRSFKSMNFVIIQKILNKEPLSGNDEQQTVGKVESTHFIPAFINSSLSHFFGCNLLRCLRLRLGNAVNFWLLVGLSEKCGKVKLVKIRA